MNKKFYTTKNPFSINQHQFLKWVGLLPADTNICDPFAGDGGLLNHFTSSSQKDFKKEAYDINPTSSTVIKNNSLLNPIKNKIIITNPPWLGSNKTKENLHIKPNQNLAWLSLNTLLKHNDYVAILLPASFFAYKHKKTILKEAFRRLWGATFITHKIFEDTDAPVALVYFVPITQHKPLNIYINNKFLDQYDLTQRFIKTLWNNGAKTPNLQITFNNENGQILGKMIDGGVKDIGFHHHSPSFFTTSKYAKPSNRAYSLICVEANNKPITFTKDDVDQLNAYWLSNRRFMEAGLTAFRGPLIDKSDFRKRLTFALSEIIISCFLKYRHLSDEDRSLEFNED